MTPEQTQTHNTAIVAQITTILNPVLRPTETLPEAVNRLVAEHQEATRSLSDIQTRTKNLEAKLQQLEGNLRPNIRGLPPKPSPTHDQTNQRSQPQRPSAKARPTDER